MKELFVILLINLFQKGFSYGQGDFDRMRRLEFKNSQLQSRLLNIERKLETQQAAQGDLNNKVEFIRINRDIKFQVILRLPVSEDFRINHTFIMNLIAI